MLLKLQLYIPESKPSAAWEAPLMSTSTVEAVPCKYCSLLPEAVSSRVPKSPAMKTTDALKAAAQSTALHDT